MSDPPLLLTAHDHLWLCLGLSHQPKRVALPWSQDPDPALASRAWNALLAGRLGAGGLGGVASHLPGSPIEPVRVGDAVARAVVEALGRKAIEAPVRDVALARESLPADAWRPDRERLLSYAEESLRSLLSSPEEIVISLSREGDRLDRLLRREKEALSALEAGAGPGTPVALYAERSTAHVAALEERRRALDRTIEESALRLLPNTSAVVGPRTAARLLAVVGGPRALLHLNASQIQLAGAGRRKPGAPTPRHGVLYHAEGMDRVPPDRRGALARSLASWAAVAVRADLLTKGSVGAAFAERRDKRVKALAQGRPNPRYVPRAPAQAAPLVRGPRSPTRVERPPMLARPTERGVEARGEPRTGPARSWNSPGRKFPPRRGTVDRARPPEVDTRRRRRR